MSRERFVMTQAKVIPNFITDHSTVFPLLRFMDANQDPYDSNNTILITDEAINIPATGLVELDFIPAGNPLSSVLVVKDDSGNVVTKTVGTAPTPTSVRVYPQRGYLDFDTSLAYKTYTATYTAAFSSVSGTALTMFSSELNAITNLILTSGLGSSSNSVSAYCLQDLAADSFVALRWIDNKLYAIKSMADTGVGNEYLGLKPMAYCPTVRYAEIEYSFSLAGLVETFGLSRGDIPLGASLYADKNGLYTWDDDASTNLTATDPLYPVGVYVGGGRGLLNIGLKSVIN